MRILFTSTRNTGHVRPLLPYAKAAQDNGHQVLFASPESVGRMIMDAGFEFAEFDHPGDAGLRDIWESARGMSRERMIETFVGRIFADIGPRAALPKLKETIGAWKPDRIVRESMEFAGAVAAAETGIPVASVRTSNGETEAFVMQSAVASVDVLRKQVGLMADGGAALRATPIFTAFPHSLDAGFAQAGAPVPFRVRTEKEHVDPASPVPDWASDDPRPLVFITFGTLLATSAENHGLIKDALAAAADLPIRGLFSIGADMDPGAFGDIPDNVTITPWVSQSDIYPRASAVVCHAGAGTVLAALSQGLPTVLAPRTTDGPDTARLVELAGAGTMLLEPDRESLRAAIMQVLSSDFMPSAAARISEEISNLPTAEDAIAAFQTLDGL